MFRKLNTKTLIATFVILLLAVVGVQVSQNNQSSRTFRSELFELDTAKVNYIRIVPKGASSADIELKKEAGNWQVSQNQTSHKADQAMIQQLLTTLSDLKPQRRVASKSSKWAKYEVTDSAAMHITAKDSEGEEFDLVVGKFSYKQQSRQMTTYVRLANEEDVYSTEGFLGMTFGRQFNDFRDKTITKLDANKLTRIKLKNPDGDFTLEKQGSKWTLAGTEADSAKVAQYISHISSLSNHNFTEQKAGIAADYQLRLEGEQLSSPIELNAYTADSVFVVESSQNTDALFRVEPIFVDRVFPRKESFLKK